MDGNIKIFIQELENCQETYEISRWQLRVMTYLYEVFGNEIANRFQSLNIEDNPFDGSARQRGYLEALLTKKESLNEKNQVNQINNKGLHTIILSPNLDNWFHTARNFTMPISVISILNSDHGVLRLLI